MTKQAAESFERQRTALLNQQKVVADRRREAAFDAANGDAAAARLIDGLARQAGELQCLLEDWRFRRKNPYPFLA